MALQFHLLKQLNCEEDCWKISVRLLRMWTEHVYMKPSEKGNIGMVFMDEEGKKISATVRKDLIKRFEGLMEEGKVYDLSRFGLADNFGRLKMTDHKCKVNFQRQTIVKPVAGGFRRSVSVFSFVDFIDINSGVIEEDRAIGVIGVLSAYSDLTLARKDGRSTKRVSFQLQNEELERLRCTLWAEHAEQFANYVRSAGHDEHIIVIVQFGRVRTWQGRPSVSNCYYGTRVLLNSTDAETLSLKKSIAADPRIPTEPEKYKDPEQLNMDLTLEEFAPGCARVLCADPTNRVITGKITRIEHDQLWYYLACCKCHCGIEDEEIDTALNLEDCKTWKCIKCNTTGYGYTYRFKVQVRVKDKSGSVSPVLFDGDTTRLLHRALVRWWRPSQIMIMRMSSLMSCIAGFGT